MRRLATSFGILSIFFLTILPLTVMGQTNLPLLGINQGTGVRAMGMGGAFVGLADDYAATYWNPAGLGQMRRMELTGSFNSLSFQSDAKYFGNSVTEKTTSTGILSLGYVFPVPTYRGSLVFALGYNRVANYNGNLSLAGFVDTPGDSVQRQGDQLDRGGLNQWVFAGSIQMSEHLFLGGALNLWTGKYNYSWELNEQDVLDIYEETNWQLRDQIDTKISGFNLSVSALYNLYNRIRLGANIETPTTFTGKEDWSSYDYRDYDDNTYWDTTKTGQYEYKIHKPLTMNFGASLSLPLLTLAGGASLCDWSQLEYTAPSELKSENSYFLKNLKTTVRYNLGAELILPLLNTRLRAGYILEPNPYKDHSQYSDKNFLTAGAGVLLDRQFTLDFAAIYGWWDYIGAGNYQQKIESFNYLVSAAFRF